MSAPRSITLLAFALACLLGHQSVAAQLTPQDEAAIRAIGDAALASLTAGDAATYAGLFREDAVMQPPDAPTVRGRAALADWARAWRAATPADARLTWPNYQLYGDGNLAYVTTDYVLEIGNGPPARGKQLGVYRRDRGGNWQIAAVSFNSDVPAGGSAAASNEAALATFYSVYNTKEYDSLDAVLAPGFRRVGSDGSTEGLAEWKAYLRQLHTTYSDFRIEVREIVFSGDRAATHWTVTAKAAASGRPVTISGMSRLRFENGRIAEQVAYFDPALLEGQ